MKKKVCHLSSVHHRYDTRILLKECISLHNSGYEVHLVVADGKGFENYNGIQIHDVGIPKGRLNRIFKTTKAVYQKGVELNTEIYHFHDPELLNVGVKLKRKGKRVIYDSHEDVPRQILDKAYLPSFLRKPVSKIIEVYEDYVVSKLSGVVTVTPDLVKRFLIKNKNVVQVRNFPKIQEFGIDNFKRVLKRDAVCYVGAISKIRGVLGMIEAMQFQNETKLLLGGKFENKALRAQATSLIGWKNVDELGFLNREEVKSTLQSSIAGLVVLEPTRSYLNSIPVKMFEYMIAGIPVIASDFPYWRKLIEDENCALFVDPNKPKEIGDAIKKLVNNPELAFEMGTRGQKAIFEKFNWSNEEKVFLDFYNTINKIG